MSDKTSCFVCKQNDELNHILETRLIDLSHNKEIKIEIICDGTITFPGYIYELTLKDLKNLIEISVINKSFCDNYGKVYKK